jgi:hypothetical protein
MNRKGQLCRVLVRGKMNSCMVEFEDGYLAVTSRNALRRAYRADTEGPLPVLLQPLVAPRGGDFGCSLQAPLARRRCPPSHAPFSPANACRGNVARHEAL